MPPAGLPHGGARGLTTNHFGHSERVPWEGVSSPWAWSFAPLLLFHPAQDPHLQPWGGGRCLPAERREEEEKEREVATLFLGATLSIPSPLPASCLENEGTEAQRGPGPCPQTCGPLVSRLKLNSGPPCAQPTLCPCTVTKQPLANQERPETRVSRSPAPPLPPTRG